MIIYIHGFGGNGSGSKAKAFRKYFKTIDEKFIAPSLSYVPQLAIETLKDIINLYDKDVYLIGSSLGGYYTTYLSNMPQVKKVVVINPATKPYETLKRSLGQAPNFYDDSTFEWNDTHIKSLEKLNTNEIDTEKFMVLLQKGDELLNYKDAQKKYQDTNLIIEDGGNHSFIGIENHFEHIIKFFTIGKQFKHTTTIKDVGVSNDKVAKNLGNLYYDDMALFLDTFARKLTLDSYRDKQKGRIKLSNYLTKASNSIHEAKKYIEKAWGICTIPTIKWMKQNGYNKIPNIENAKNIPKELNNFNTFKEIRSLYDDTNILPLRLEYNIEIDKNNMYKKVYKFLKRDEYVFDKNIFLNKIIIDYYKNQGFKIVKNHIKPNKQSYDIGDCDIYWRWFSLERYIAIKNDIVFYFDIEDMGDEDNSFIVFHYANDAKDLIEKDFLAKDM